MRDPLVVIEEELSADHPLARKNPRWLHILYRAECGNYVLTVDPEAERVDMRPDMRKRFGLHVYGELSVFVENLCLSIDKVDYKEFKAKLIDLRNLINRHVDGNFREEESGDE